MSLKVTDLRLRRAHFELGPISLELRAGECCALIGANGSGKSSLLKALLGRLPTTGGSLSGLPRQRAAIGLEPLLIESWSIQGFINWYGLLAGNPRDETFLSELKNYRSMKISWLSSGWKRFVEASCVLSHSFEIYFLDEVFVHLDPRRRQQLEGLIKRRLQSGAMVILTAHSADELEKLSFPCRQIHLNERAS